MAQRVPHTWTAQALLLVALALCYMPALTATYGYADDFVQLNESQGRIKWLEHAWNEAARPIGGVLTEWSFRAAGTIKGLAYLRAAGLVLLLLLAAAIYRHLLRLLHEPVLAGLAAAFVCTVTPFQVNVGWASMWLYLIPPLLSYAAYAAILRGGKWLVPALLLLYISLTIYPPSTMFLWFWFATDAVLADTGAAPLMRRFLLFLGMCGAAFVAYYGIYRAFGYHHARGEVATDVAGKAKWFLGLVVPLTSRLQWFDCASLWLPVIVWLIIVVGVFLLRGGPVVSLALKAGICAAVVFLAYLPLLVVKELDAPIRSRTVLAAYIGALAFLGVLGILVRVGVPARVRYVALGVLVAAGMVKANANLVWHVVAPQSHDYLFLKGALGGALAGHKQVVLMVGAAAPNCWDELCRVTSELGTEYPMLSSMAGLIVRESWGPALENRLRVVARGTQVAASGDTAVIDMGAE